MASSTGKGESRIIIRKKGVKVYDETGEAVGLLPFGERFQAWPQNSKYAVVQSGNLTGNMKLRMNGKQTSRIFNPPLNWRDVGEFGTFLPRNRIFRCGRWDGLNEPTRDHVDLGCPSCVIIARPKPDPPCEKVKFIHMSPPNTVEERYDTSQKEVQQWLRKIVKGIETEEITFPILVHCNHGRDRTGIVVCALLLILGVNQEDIIQDFLLTTGARDRLELFHWAIQGIIKNGLQNYFKHYNKKPIDLDIVRKKILGEGDNVEEN